MKKYILIALVVLSIIACNKETASKNKVYGESNKMDVVATIGMIGDVAQNIGGERVSVYSMMGPGVDPHLYKAKAGDVARLSDADLILYNGIHLEAKMGDILEKLSQTQNITMVSHVIPEDSLITVEQAHDPHIWFDVSNWIAVAGAIKDALISTDPAGIDVYQSHYDTYVKELQDLDNYVKKQAHTIPQDQRVLITAHDAFNYFGRAYGFEVRGLQGISTVDEAGTGDVRNLADFIADKKIGALFVESSVSPKSIKALQAAVINRGWNVTIGGELFSDAMGDSGSFKGTYIGMVTHNIDTIVSGLKGEDK
ncbi:metal ABC transporter solute-binding protein, Zn/Mn family [Spirochaeta cellobiosiphila]|uniref:metal ABC transporter solute-binding protein, Zn/Mn family n=1 Tax=Spirochaeta cellobiosiphila TaxID=504483 RepID=UPI000412F91B|nr:zinc ABC transporter substrate-binding protein [Spirochaeta cellobiosiphila]